MTHFEPAPLTALFVPGDRPERFEKAYASGAEVVVFDLEDGVAPGNKDRAREAVRKRLLEDRRGVVRLNAGQSQWYDGDIAALYNTSPQAVMLAKAEHPDDLIRARRTFGAKTAIVLLIETALGLRSLPQLLQTTNIWFAAFGSLDYALDIGSAHSYDALLHARSEIVFQCRLGGIPAPLDGVTVDFDNADVIERESRRSADLGFGGKLAVHPKQIKPIRSGFLPTDDERRWAESVVAAARLGGVVQVNGAMVDEPVIQRARQIIRLFPG